MKIYTGWLKNTYAPYFLYFSCIFKRILYQNTTIITTTEMIQNDHHLHQCTSLASSKSCPQYHVVYQQRSHSMPSSMLASTIRQSGGVSHTLSPPKCSIRCSRGGSSRSWAVFIALRFFKAFYSLPYGRLMYTKKSTNLTFLNTALMHSDNSWSKFFHAC